MNTTPHSHSDSSTLVMLFAVVAAALAAATAVLLVTARPTPTRPPGGDLVFLGFAGRELDSAKPALQAYFTRESYRPGDVAKLVVRDDAAGVTVVVYHAGTVPQGPANDEMRGTPVGEPVQMGGRHVLRLDVGAWPTGLYFARVSSGARVGYAPFVLRPGRLGEHRVAVVLPTNTWQAYNFRDENRDGVGDTWYADSRRIDRVHTLRAFLNRGVPPHYRGYDFGFLRWLDATKRPVDYLCDRDLESVSGERLARAYDLVVFPGHTEYVTAAEYDAVTRYRDLGGNLAFLASNNFFYRVDRRGAFLYRAGRWRDLGRPESALIGSQYLNWNEDRYGNKPYVVTATESAPWLFAGSGLRNGSRFGVYGIEIDSRTSASPPGTKVLARIPNVFGPGQSAEMTYYATGRGAKVFAAGSMNFGGSALWPTTRTLLGNLWEELTAP